MVRLDRVLVTNAQFRHDSAMIPPLLRIFHTSDWHLGRTLYGKSLIDDQRFALNQLCQLIRARKPHGLLISGDIFDRPFPPEEAVQLLHEFFETVIMQEKTPVFMIPGNHDSNERLGFNSGLLRSQQLNVYARIEDAQKPVELRGDGDVTALIYGIPFVESSEIGALLGRSDLNSFDLAIPALCESLLSQHDFSKLSVLLCHAFVAGGESSESERDIIIGGTSAVSMQAFKGFDYTALGHLHKPQTLGAKALSEERESSPTNFKTGAVRYSGSLLTYSKSEISNRKSVTEVMLAKDGLYALETHELGHLRGFEYREGELKDLLTEQTATDGTLKINSNYVIVGLTDRGPVLEAAQRLRDVFPNLLHVSRVRSDDDVTSRTDSQTTASEREQATELELFSEFFARTMNTEMSAEERTHLIDILSEIEQRHDNP